MALAAVYPSNAQVRLHLAEFLRNGYRPALGACEVRFTHTGDLMIQPHSVSLVDGFTKVIIMAGTLCMISQLDLTDAELECLKPVLESFRAIKCSYTHYAQASQHFLHGLRRLVIIADSVCC